MKLNQINTNTIEGRYLMAALAKLTTESQIYNTPDEVLEQCNLLQKEMYKEIEEQNKTGIELIAQERKRQIEKEGWSKERDQAQHTDEELVKAAICYATPLYKRKMYGATYIPEGWPWDDEWWKPSADNRIRELVKAGALIAAEIDRLNEDINHG